MEHYVELAQRLNYKIFCSLGLILFINMIILAKKFNFQLSTLFRKTYFRIYVKRKFKSWNVMFFGTDEFARVSLEGLFEYLEKKKIGKLEVVSMSEKTEVAKYAASRKLRLHMWPPPLTDPFDIGIVVSFGKLIPKKIIDFFPLGILNVHGSLLPQYRGASPIFHAIKNGDSMTGITVMKIKPFKFDTGDIVLQESCEIGSDDLIPYVSERLAHLGSKCLLKTIDGLPHSLDNSVQQNSHQTSSAPKIFKEIAVIKWDEATAEEIYNLYRGLFGLYKLSTTWNSNTIKLICISTNFVGQSKLFKKVDKLPPGTLEYCRESRILRVHCLDKPLYLCTLQIAHKMLVAFDFYRGHLRNVPKDKWIFQ